MGLLSSSYDRTMDHASKLRHGDSAIRQLQHLTIRRPGDVGLGAIVTRDRPPMAKSFNKIADGRQRALEEILGTDLLQPLQLIGVVVSVEPGTREVLIHP